MKFSLLELLMVVVDSHSLKWQPLPQPEGRPALDQNSWKTDCRFSWIRCEAYRFTHTSQQFLRKFLPALSRDYFSFLSKADMFRHHVRFFSTGIFFVIRVPRTTNHFFMEGIMENMENILSHYQSRGPVLH